MAQAVQTPPTSSKNRWQEIQKIWADNRWLYVVVGVLLGIISVPAIEQITGDLNALIGNLVPEAVGIVFTVLILDRLADNRAKQELRDELYSDLHSVSNDTVLNALHRLREKGWVDKDYHKDKDFSRANWEGAYIGGMNFEQSNLESAIFKQVTTAGIDGNHPVNFKGALLVSAHLAGAYLWEANLSGAELYKANLSGANLWEAHLAGANLWKANLSGVLLVSAQLASADLSFANLEGARLSFANLEGTSLFRANLEGASLIKANLEGTDLRDANLEMVKWSNEDGRYPATLPDGTTWTPETNMMRFTNPDHSDYPSTLEKINAIRKEQGREPLK